MSFAQYPNPGVTISQEVSAKLWGPCLPDVMNVQENSVQELKPCQYANQLGLKLPFMAFLIHMDTS